MTQLKAIYEGEGGCGLYFEFLAEMAEVFMNLYGDFTKGGRDTAMTALSDLFKVANLELDADLFFIDSADFICLDFGPVEAYLNEKFSVILLFIRRALSRNLAELGIYSTPDEYDDSVVLDKNNRARLGSDLSAINWFLTASMAENPEFYFIDGEMATLAPIVSTDDTDQISVDEMITLDNERRPLK